MSNKSMPKEKKKKSQKFLSWLNFQNLLFLLVIMVFVVIIVWSDPLSQAFQQPTPPNIGIEPTPTTLPGTPTPLPEEWTTSAQQTNGIILGAVVIIIAITAGSAVVLLGDRKN